MIQILPLLKVNTEKSKWVNTTILLGWTGFPVVFFLAPTGFGLFGSAIAMGLYLVLDIYTKIIFNLQLKA
jgi:bacteriorhodopsin